VTGLRAVSAASSGIASTDADPTGWRLALPAGEFDRGPALLPREAEALEALSPTELRRNRARGLPRRTAGHWKALARLVEPLDAARAAVHHDEDVRYRRRARRRRRPTAVRSHGPGLLGVDGLGLGEGLRTLR
jgi:hypothetical protein